MESSSPTDEAPVAAVAAGGVLDASALLALVYAERGVERVQLAIRRGALMSVVSWAESLSRMAERGESVESAAARVKAQVDALGTLMIVQFDEDDAVAAAGLRMATKHLGVSLADRACLALARLRRLPVLTTDRAWRSLRISVRIEVIR
jgi:PIN domain nuclease of toxin-antitoxin system